MVIENYILLIGILCVYLVIKSWGLGLRSFLEMNQALIGKLAWKYINEPETPWVTILRDRYSRNQSLMLGEPKATDSTVWKTVVKGIEVLKRGCTIRSANGQATSFW